MTLTGNSNGHGQPIDLAIIGGGIGGLSLLLGILEHTSRTLIRPHLYESAPAFSEIGAGIGFGPNARQAMLHVSPAFHEAYCRIAAEAELVEIDGETKAVWNELRMGMDGHGLQDPRESRNKLKAGELICTVYHNNPKKNVHRATLLDEMIKLLPRDEEKAADGDVSHQSYRYVTFRKRCTEITLPDPSSSSPTDHLTLHFADSTTASVHAVVGADGVKSRIRQILLTHPSIACPPSLISPRFTGKYAYRGLIPMEDAVVAIGEVARRSHMIWGYDGHLVCFPVDRGKTLNVVAFYTQATTTQDGQPHTWPYGDDRWVIPADTSRVLADFRDFSGDVRDLLRRLRTPDVWAIFEHPPAPTYALAGRICLLGDCAHSSSPHQGAGAGMAIEDAAVLAHLLGRASSGPADLARVFAAYDRVRRPRTQRLVVTSRDAGQLYDFQKPAVHDDPDALRAEIRSRMAWIWNLDMRRHIDEAVEIMKTM